MVIVCLTDNGFNVTFMSLNFTISRIFFMIFLHHFFPFIHFIDLEKDKTKEPRRKKLVKKQKKNNSSSSSSSSSEDEEDSSMKKKGRKKLPPNQKCQNSPSSKLSVPSKEDPVPEKMEEDDDDVLDLMDDGDKREKGSKDMDVTEKNKKSGMHTCLRYIYT